MKANIPNILTWIRIAAIPLVVWFFFSDIRVEGDNFARPLAGILFGLAPALSLGIGRFGARLLRGGQDASLGILTGVLA